MKKKMYEKPSMQVFELKHQPQLLQASAERAERRSYGDSLSEDWE